MFTEFIAKQQAEWERSGPDRVGSSHPDFQHGRLPCPIALAHAGEEGQMLLGRMRLYKKQPTLAEARGLLAQDLEWGLMLRRPRKHDAFEVCSVCLICLACVRYSQSLCYCLPCEPHGTELCTTSYLLLSASCAEPSSVFQSVAFLVLQADK